MSPLSQENAENQIASNFKRLITAVEFNSEHLKDCLIQENKEFVKYVIQYLCLPQIAHYKSAKKLVELIPDLVEKDKIFLEIQEMNQKNEEAILKEADLMDMDNEVLSEEEDFMTSEEEN